MIELTFDTQLRDLLTGYGLYYRSTFWCKMDKVVAILLVAFGFVATFFVGPYWWCLIWLPLGVFEWFDLLSFRKLRVWLVFKRDPKFRETYHLVFSDTGIDFKMTTLNSHIKWQHYKRLLENQSVFVLVWGNWLYTVLPKRAFENSSQVDAFRALASRHLGGP